MALKFFTLGALALCISLPAHAAPGASDVANVFIDALQHHRYGEAAAMFAPAADKNIAATEQTLERIDHSVGGLSTIHPIATLPDGKSVKLELQGPPLNGQKFVQVRYAATAGDGQPVFYALNLTNDGASPKILSFALHFPAADAQSSRRANQLVKTINR